MHLGKFLFVSTLVVASLVTSSVLAKTDAVVVKDPHKQDRLIRKMIREYVGKDPVLPIIAGCESTGNPNLIAHWNKDGSLVKNPYSSARGAFQVLLQLHAEEIKEHNLDMKRLSDYLHFVKQLYELHGYSPWSPSKKCWGKYAYLGSS